MKVHVLLGLALAVAIAAAGCAGTGTGTATPTPAPAGDGGLNETLSLFAAGSGALLNATDANVSRVAAELGLVGLNGSAADAALLNLSRSAGFVADAVTYTLDGRVAAAAPATYGSLVGRRIVDPAAPVDYYTTPYLSPYFTLAEGFGGVALGYPVLDANRTVLGDVSIAMHPDLLLQGPAEAARGTRSLALTAVETDGTILYDSNPALVGRSLNETSTGLAGVASRISAAPSGAAVYRAPNSTVDRTLAWATVGLHGTQWRLVVAQR